MCSSSKHNKPVVCTSFRGTVACLKELLNLDICVESKTVLDSKATLRLCLYLQILHFLLCRQNTARHFKQFHAAAVLLESHVHHKEAPGADTAVPAGRKHRNIYISDSQPGCQGTLCFLEILSRVPRGCHAVLFGWATTIHKINPKISNRNPQC